MKPSHNLNLICLNKILKYINVIEEIYDFHNIKSVSDLQSNFMCQLAVTQAITNIFELQKKMQAEILSKTPLFSKLFPTMSAARNIASHDYESVDFEIIYRVTKQLTDKLMIQELEMLKNDIKRSQTGNT